MKYRKFNIAALLLAVLMMCILPFKIYAAGIPSLEDAKSDCIRHMGNVKLSDFYYKFINVSGLNSDYATFMFVNQDVADSNKNLLIYKYYYTDVYQLRFAKFENGEVVDINSARTRFGINYTVDGAWLNCTSNAGSAVVDQSNFEKYYNSEIETNLPYFDSLDSAKAYYETGDTSGLLNGDNFQTYDKSIETPRDMRVDMDADFRAQMGYAPSNAPDDANASNSTCVFTWSQSEEVVKAGNYETEIYYQTTFVHHSNMFAIGKKTFSLSSSVLVASVPVTRAGMTYTMDFKQITKIYEEWQDSGLIGGTLKPTYPTEPYYFYIRNKVGNNYGNWVRVTVTNDNITTSNTITGASTVTGGYDEIDGSSATFPGVNQKLDGDTVADSQYGKKYSVDIDSADLDSVVGKLRKGFGILGDNGLIALLNGFFSFIPDEYFSVLITFVSGACILGVLFLVLRR